ncbi:S-adenosyl-L-methionine-dependent methyltransferase [Haematococcus lacustris]
MVKGERPEHQAPPEVFYNEDEAHKYTHNSRIIAIQAQLTRRAVELLALPAATAGVPRLLLDLGCGSGLSGQELSDMVGHVWVGADISPAMLDVAVDRECEGDLLLSDLGHGLPLRAGCFDGAISISALQWLCNADRSSHDPRRRLRRFFETLYASLVRGARAVLQVYPESPAQAEMMVAAAMKCGFSGGLVVDFPHSTRAKKYFLVLMVGTTSYLPAAKGLDGSEPQDEEEGDVEMRDSSDAEGEQGAAGEEQTEVKVSGRERRRGKGLRKVGLPRGVKPARGGVAKPAKGSKTWVHKKKDSMRKRGYAGIPEDTKYTGRKRSKFRQ